MQKACGKSGILPELVIHGGPELWGRNLKLMEQVWEDSEVALMLGVMQLLFLFRRRVTKVL